MSVRIAVIADDFTGGLFVASNLEKLGIPVFYVCDTAVLHEAADGEVLVIATRLRFMPPARAVAALDGLTTISTRSASSISSINTARHSIPPTRAISALAAICSSGSTGSGAWCLDLAIPTCAPTCTRDTCSTRIA